jgi:uncharacterized protein (TIGR00297 family)
MSASRRNRSALQSAAARSVASSAPFTPISPTPGLFSRWGRLVLGFVLSSGIGLLAYRRRSLTKGGVAGAVATGTAIFGLGGWSWGLALIYFFVSSTLLSHFREKEKEHTAADKFSKGSRRDLAQVAANGGLASLCAALAGTTDSEPLQQTLQAGFAGALATATADTWATEVGVLSSHEPRLLTTGRPVAPGTSGGITPLGSAASALGAFTLGLALWATRGLRRSLAALPVISLISGMAGSLCDSLLGATVQAMYFCPTCQRETERRVHSCGTRTCPLRGVPWCNNDVVNFFATCAGSCTAIVLHRVTYLITRPKKRTASRAEL